MASFEQNQQNQVNMNNSIDQIKQWQAEWDKAAASIGDAELAAEEELLGVRLKNLTKAQQTKLVQLGQLLELEEKGIQELAKLKLTLSNRQFAVRKKEIQKEFQLYKAAAEELVKAESKRKVSTQGNTSTKSSSSTNDLKASSKKAPADVAIQKASRKVRSAEYAASQVSQEITNAISALQEIAQATTEAAQSKAKPQVEQKPGTTTGQDTNQQGAQPVTPKVTETHYGDGGLASDDKVDLGEYSLGSVLKSFDALRGYLDNSRKLTKEQSEDPGKLETARLNKAITKNLNSITAQDKDGNFIANASKTTIDLAGNLLKAIEETRKAEEEFQEFKKDQELNTQLLIQKREQERIKELSAKEREQIEERARIEADIAFNAAHTDELLAQKVHEKQIGYSKEYAEYQRQAGKYAIDREEFEKNRARKANAAAKKEATSGIVEAISSGRLAKLFSTDNKEAVSKYKGQRTAELKDKYNNEKLKDGKTRREHAIEKLREKELKKLEKEHPEMSAEEREAKATEAAKKGADKAAEASAKLSVQFELLAEVSGNLAQQLSQTADKIGEKQAPIDTRLQGSQVNDTKFGSYWRQLAKEMNAVGAVNPYFKQEDFANNIAALVDKGISFDIKQRAFLMTIQEKIANTFDVADGTLLRLIRIQQQDTTAGRLGMESALNSFLNSMYETSEYLTNVASSVRSSLEEMQSLMEGAAGTELEFQVQKWMGSLYSVGMSQDAVQGIAKTFGQIASGDVGGLTGSGTGNLIIMAANEAGKSIADILQEGLDAKETNELMQAMVNYLAEIAETSSDSRVVQQQLANVYGLKASDLRAATNLASSIKDVSKQDLTYSGMLGQLNKMANSMILRTSTGEMLSNVWGNVQYTMGTQMASNPILYLLPKVATLLEDFAGGIDLPFLNVMGFGVDLNTSVAQLMNVASMSGTILGALGPMISGLAGAVSGSAMLNLAGINAKEKAPVIARGSAQPLQHLGGSSISESGYVGNASGNDVKNATLQDAEDSKKKQMIKAKDEESSDDVVIKSQLAVVSIYNLLEEVAHGSQSLRVRLVNGNGAGGAGALSCNCNHTDPLTGEPSTSVTTPGQGSDGTDNGNWVLTF